MEGEHASPEVQRGKELDQVRIPVTEPLLTQMQFPGPHAEH